MSTPFQQQPVAPQGRPSGGKGKQKQSSGSALGNLLGGGKTYFLLAILAALGATFIAFSLLGSSAERSTYYVLGQSVPARSEILPSMLIPVETAAGTEPLNAFDPADLADPETRFAKIPLQAGDIVTASVVGPLERIDTDLGSEFVVSSFVVDPQNAVAGKVRRGDYIDIFAVGSVNNGNVVKLVLHKVFVLDVTVDPSTIAQGANDTSIEASTDGQSDSPGPESNAVRGGIPYLYTVALTPEDTAKLALVRGNNLMVALASPDAPDVDVYVDESTVFGEGEVGDSSIGIDREAVLNPDVTLNDGTTGEPVTPVEPAPSGSAAPVPGSSPSAVPSLPASGDSVQEQG